MLEEIKTDMGELQKEFISHAAGTEEPAEEVVETQSVEETIVEPAEQVKPEEKPKPIETATEEQLDDYWSTLKEDGVEVPEFIRTGKNDKGETLTKKEKLEALREYLLDLSQFGNTEEDDAFVREYMISSTKEGFDRKQWLKEQTERSDIMELPSKEFMRQVLKSQAKQNKFDWSDDDIESKLSSMSKVDLDMQANQYKAQMKTYNDRVTEDRMKENVEKQKQNLEKSNKTITDNISQWVSKNQDKRKLGGFEFDEAEAAELFKELPEFMTKKPVDLPDGSKGFYSEADLTHARLLSNDEDAMRFSIYLLLVKKGKLEGFLSDKLEQKKKQIEKTLDDSPEDASTGLAGETGFDKRAYIKAATTQ